MTRTSYPRLAEERRVWSEPQVGWDRFGWVIKSTPDTSRKGRGAAFRACEPRADQRVIGLSDLASRFCGRHKSHSVRPDANARTQTLPGEGRRVGRHCAGRSANDQPFGDRFEIGAEMHRTLVDEDGLLGRLDADIAVHRLIRELRLVRAH